MPAIFRNENLAYWRASLYTSAPGSDLLRRYLGILECCMPGISAMLALCFPKFCLRFIRKRQTMPTLDGASLGDACV